MNKEEYKKFTASIGVKHVKFPSGLEIDIIIPKAVEMMDALINAKIDLKELFSRLEDIQKEAQEAHKKGKAFFNLMSYQAHKALADILKDTDGEQITLYIVREDYPYLVEIVDSFFSELPSLRSLQEQQSSSKSDTKPSDSGPTISSK